MCNIPLNEGDKKLIMAVVHSTNMQCTCTDVVMFNCNDVQCTYITHPRHNVMQCAVYRYSITNGVTEKHTQIILFLFRYTKLYLEIYSRLHNR